MDFNDLLKGLNNTPLPVNKESMLEGAKKILSEMTPDELLGVKLDITVKDGVSHLSIDLQRDAKGVADFDFSLQDGDKVELGNLMKMFAKMLADSLKGE
ncbi:hypothetical protein KSL82_08840 [Limosilactobacillus portuensis]|uniref:SCP2 domain-containing protein n=1 Tax=Limosilactobacillus portuensis TaxID=2742601 RepID=A0ABS6IYC5_9LACO|nr:hypothetical protein [Limosilactobacillus portuensis]MBU9695986.1 hypothetical protein [Limosilactobacillus portuensis]